MTDLICDGNSLYARCFYAAKGNPFDVVPIFFRAALRMIDPELMGTQVDRTMFCWDGGQKKPKERAPRPPEYNSLRPVAMDNVRDLLGSINVRIEGYEADDLIATAALSSTADKVIVASGDKDLQQLHGNRVVYFDLNTKGFLNERRIVGKWGVKKPIQVAIALAIQGDSADKITGIKGWGPKKVRQLFQAVKPEMQLAESLAVIQDQIPEDKLPEFYESLGLTLLDTNIKGIPCPRAIEFIPASELINYGLEECESYYASVAHHYDVDGDLLCESEVENWQ